VFRELHGILGEGRDQFEDGLFVNLHLINVQPEFGVELILERLKVRKGERRPTEGATSSLSLTMYAPARYPCLWNRITGVRSMLGRLSSLSHPSPCLPLPAATTRARKVLASLLACNADQLR
jgi:hypothetical protein